MKIILVSPEIPQNVGNIARTCAVTHTECTIVRPFNLSLSDRKLRRPGLDYWKDVQINIVDSLDTEIAECPFYFFSTKGKRLYTESAFEENAALIFGSETAGLPAAFHQRWPDRFYTIPMSPTARSLNLSNAVAIVLYEALRQKNFRGLQKPFCATPPNP